MNITPFDFNTQTVRTVLIDEEPWFHATDVCTALGYVNSRDAVTKHVDDDDKRSVSLPLPGSAPTFLNESGMYALIFGSHLVAARAFQRWVTKEVLPTIRRTGSYGPAIAPDPAVLAIVRSAYEEADRAVERRTQHDFYSSSPRAAERRAAIVAEEAAKRSLDASAVAAANQQSVTEVMATRYGDPDARRLLERQRARIDAEVTERLRLRAPRRRRR